MPQLRSRTSTHGRNMAGARALWRATGMEKSDFGKPIIAIANSYTQFVPGHVHLKNMGDLVAGAIKEAGGIGREFNTIAVDDGIAMGHGGMLYSLPSRDVIADSVEYMANAHCADALVCISNCDKITPGMLMAAMRLNIPVVFYDQIGIGASSHPEKGKGPDKDKFWTMEVFMDELDNLLRHLGIEGEFDLLGHSWGAFLGVHYASNRVPRGLRRLILADGTCAMELWTQGTDALRLNLPEDVQRVLREHEEKGTTSSKEYQDAMELWFSKHICKLNPMPELLAKSFGAMEEDPTVYGTMCVVWFLRIALWLTPRREGSAHRRSAAQER